MAPIGRDSWLRLAESGMVNQFVESPAFKLLICACSRQPKWSSGHIGCYCPEAITRDSGGGIKDKGRALTSLELPLSPATFNPDTKK